MYFALAIEKIVTRALLPIEKLNATPFRPANPLVPDTKPTTIRRTCRMLALTWKSLKDAPNRNRPLDCCEKSIEVIIRPYNRIILYLL